MQFLACAVDLHIELAITQVIEAPVRYKQLLPMNVLFESDHVLADLFLLGKLHVNAEATVMLDEHSNFKKVLICVNKVKPVVESYVVSIVDF